VGGLGLDAEEAVLEVEVAGLGVLRLEGADAGVGDQGRQREQSMILPGDVDPIAEIAQHATDLGERMVPTPLGFPCVARPL
jgi:hypothetical protein